MHIILESNSLFKIKIKQLILFCFQVNALVMEAAVFPRKNVTAISDILDKNVKKFHRSTAR